MAALRAIYQGRGEGGAAASRDGETEADAATKKGALGTIPWIGRKPSPMWSTVWSRKERLNHPLLTDLAL